MGGGSSLFPVACLESPWGFSRRTEVLAWLLLAVSGGAVAGPCHKWDGHPLAGRWEGDQGEEVPFGKLIPQCSPSPTSI